eukprot:scaffold5758_cov69-Skeletonema_marinoi.AAC.6
MGWMHIPAGGKLRDAFPAGMKICGKFVTRGFQCDREDCKGHYISPTQLSEDNLQALCEHLFDTQAGWINKWKAKELKLDEKYLDTIVGIAGKPPKAKGAPEGFGGSGCDDLSWSRLVRESVPDSGES